MAQADDESSDEHLHGLVLVFSLGVVGRSYLNHVAGPRQTTARGRLLRP